MILSKTIHLSRKAVDRIHTMAAEKHISFSEAVELLSEIINPVTPGYEN